MEILHQLGHQQKWPIDSYFVNGIGDGFVFGAYNLDKHKIGDKISGHGWSEFCDISFFDLQFYANRASGGGKLDTYPFHPINLHASSKTIVDGVESVAAAVRLQYDSGFRRIIVPAVYYASDDVESGLSMLSEINKAIVRYKKRVVDAEFYMTLCIPKDGIGDGEYLDRVLAAHTDMSMVFDGYYVVIECEAGFKQKIPTNVGYMNGVTQVFSTLSEQGFKTIWGYANWDALLFLANMNFDAVTIGTYENLRNFNLSRYTDSRSGGRSKGWYYSEKLLNFVRAQDLEFLRMRGCLDLIANEKNIFSDIILNEDFVWDMHKPDVHKNYLLAIERDLRALSSVDIKKRKSILVKRVQGARELYHRIGGEYRVFLSEESSDYHLTSWLNYLHGGSA